MRITKRLNKYYLICLIVILIISSNVLLELFYYKASSLTLLIVNSFIMILYSFVVFYSINDKNKTIQIQAEYDALLNNLNEYEKMLELQRINNHENKNQLVIIKSMCHSNNKKLKNYIDSIIEDNKEDDKNLQNLTKKIPAGGLRGLIYYKCLAMKEKNIYLQLEIEKDLDKKVDLLNSGKINQEICKIVGVFLDNAIEASEDTTEKIVSLELYMEYDKFVIAIGNTYFGNLNVEKIAQGGYTTKGDNHGYGLKLVNSIVENNRNLEKETNVIGRVFQQKLKIKLQNN